MGGQGIEHLKNKRGLIWRFDPSHAATLWIAIRNRSWAMNQESPQGLSQKVWVNPWGGSSSVWSQQSKSIRIQTSWSHPRNRLLEFYPILKASRQKNPEKIKQNYLELSEDAYEDASVKCWLGVACGDAALDLLEREAGNLLHDLRRTLHLLTLKSHQRLLRL